MSESDLDHAPGVLETDAVLVRAMRLQDLEAIIQVDERIGGRSRRKYFEVKVPSVLRDAGVRISLVAEVDGAVAGFLLASVFYGEFGIPEPAATIDTIGVHPEFRGRKVGRALMRQLIMNLQGLGIDVLETQVDWDNWSLLHFLADQGFEPAARICLKRSLRQPARG